LTASAATITAMIAMVDLLSKTAMQ
jgi:hypothetical protein